MKKVIFCMFLIFGLCASSKADWVFDGKINRNNSKDATCPAIVTTDYYLYLAWCEKNDMNNIAIYASRFRDGKIEALGDNQSNTYTTYAFSPRLAFDAKLYLAFGQFTNSGNEIKLNDWQTVWNANTSFTVFLGQSDTIDLTIFNSQPYVTFRKRNLGEIYFNTFVQRLNGSAWEPVGDKINQDGFISLSSEFCVANGTLYILYSEAKVDSPSDFYVKYYDGSMWQYLGEKINAPGESTENCYIKANTKNEICVFYSTLPNKVTMKKYIYPFWQKIAETTFEDKDSPFMFFMFNDEMYITYQDKNKYFLVKKMQGDTWLNVGSFLNVNPDNRLQEYSPTVLAWFNNYLYAAWAESNGANYDVYLKHFVPSLPAPTSTSTPAFFSESNKGSWVYAAPNPVLGSIARIHVFCNQPSQTTLKLFTLASRELRSVERCFQAGDNVEDMDVSDLANGAYFLYVKARTDQGQEEKMTTKIVITK